jgi:hypothetical protein
MPFVSNVLLLRKLELSCFVFITFVDKLLINRTTTI